LAVCKILLESRSMRKDEMLPILDKMIDCAVPEDSQKAVRSLIANEELHYIEPHHGQRILDGLWDLGQAIKNHQVIEIEYERMKEPKLVRRRVQPVGIMFDQYYFYLTAFLKDREHFENPEDLFPTIYRIDRIRTFQVLDEHFQVPYQGRFEEGEFRKRVQFMYGGKLERIKFRYTGPSIEAVLDRLPTAQVVAQDETGWDIEAEVFGKGIEMWLRSQGENIQNVQKVVPFN
jgi:predicted DNA-binding transcriptional regulator YafY